MNIYRKYSPALVCAVSVLSVLSARAEDNTTVIISGSISNNAGGNYNVGSSGTNNFLGIDSGGQLTNVFDINIGNLVTASNNSALVTGAGSYWEALNRLHIGKTGSSNSLTVADGANVSGATRVFLGFDIASSYNRALVTGPGSVLQTYASFSQNFFVGRFGGNNSLTISNGGAALGPGPGTDFLCELIVGGGNLASSNNTVLVSGPGSIWSGNSTLQIGAGPGSGNRLTIADGGQVTVVKNAFIGFDVPGVGASNSVLVTGPGFLLQSGLDPDFDYWLAVGYTSPGNTLTVSNGGTVKCAFGYVGQFFGTNSALVTGSGSSWQISRNFSVGYSGGLNSLAIRDGGAVTNVGDAFIGYHAGTNQVLVTGAGSVWHGQNLMWLGFDPDMGNNSLTISNGGAVLATRGIIGGLGGNNTVLVTGPGSVWDVSEQIDVGQYSADNTLSIANGGLVHAGFIAMNSNNSVLNLGDGTARATARMLNVDMTHADDRLNFNAGMLSATANSANFITGAGSVYVQSGGAVIDSQTFTVTIPVALQQDGASPGGGLTKIGNGILTLAAANTYSGVTTVSNGTLNVTGSLNSGADVKSDATLTGVGIISGPVTVEANATLQPGLGGLDTSTLTINNTLNLAGTTMLALNRTSAQNSSRISGITTLTRGGTLTVVNVGAALQAGDTFTLFNASDVSGTFTATNLPSLGTSGLAWKFNPASGVLEVVSTVNPTPTNIVYSVSDGNLSLTWPASHLGWYAQSNSVNVAVAASWFDIPGSQTTTNLSLVIDPVLPNVFYRLRLP